MVNVKICYNSGLIDLLDVDKEGINTLKQAIEREGFSGGCTFRIDESTCLLVNLELIERIEIKE